MKETVTHNFYELTAKRIPNIRQTGGPMNLRKSTISAKRTFAAVLSAAMLIPFVSFATSNDQTAAEELKAILTAQPSVSSSRESADCSCWKRHSAFHSLQKLRLKMVCSGISQAGFCRKPQSFWASRMTGAIPPVHSLPGSIQS